MRVETYKKKAEKLYKKQKRRINELRKRGYIIEDLKPLPKKIDKKVYQRLEKQLTLENLYNSPKNFYIETNTKGMQKIVSAKRGREIERSKAGKKAAITRKKKKIDYENDSPPQWCEVIIEGIKRQIKELSGGLTEIEKELTLILDFIVERDGCYETALRVYNAELNLTDIIGEIIFYYETRKQISFRLINEFKELLLGQPLTPKEKYVEKMKYEDNKDEYLEV